MDDTEEASL
jgi:hypothetical protein